MHRIDNTVIYVERSLKSLELKCTADALSLMKITHNNSFTFFSLFFVLPILITCSSLTFAEDVAPPSRAFLFKLSESLVKVSTTTTSGGHGYGTGVAISKDHVVTNCHVLQDANGVGASLWGNEYQPVSMQADWKHDLCILKFSWVDFKPATMGDASNLYYEQPVISISLPSDSTVPYPELSHIKALYPFDDSQIIRTKAAFSIGASGSPVFDYEGKLIAISTFKSPGKNAYFYNMPVKWVKALLKTAPIEINAAHDSPLWDQPLEKRPYFMQVVLPYKDGDWKNLEKIAANWVESERKNVEALYYLGESKRNLDDLVTAKKHLESALRLQQKHPASLHALALIENKSDNPVGVDRIRLVLKEIDVDLLKDLDAELKE